MRTISHVIAIIEHRSSAKARTACPPCRPIPVLLPLICRTGARRRSTDGHSAMSATSFPAPPSRRRPALRWHSRPRRRGATVRHLLDMRAGIVLEHDAQRAYNVATNWSPLPAGQVLTGLHRFFETLTTPPRAHGGAFSYVSANTDLLGWVLERATGQSFASLLSALLWKPMGAEDGAYITLDRDGAPRCTGGLCATARDLARLGQLLVQEGRTGSLEVVAAEWIDDIENNGDREAWRTGEFAASFGRRSMSYRSGWHVIRDAPRTLFAMGIHGQNLFIDRANRLVIAKMSSQASPIDPAAIALTHRAVAEIRRCVLGRA